MRWKTRVFSWSQSEIEKYRAAREKHEAENTVGQKCVDQDLPGKYAVLPDYKKRKTEPKTRATYHEVFKSQEECWNKRHRSQPMTAYCQGGVPQGRVQRGREWLPGMCTYLWGREMAELK